MDPIPAEEGQSLASFRWLIPLAYTAFLTALSLLRYHLFLATGWDLGFYEQGLWALVHEGVRAWSSWGQYPFLARSGAWILWPLAYLYGAFGVGVLMVLQAFSYGVGYLFLFDLAVARGLSWKATRILGWLYLLSPLAWGANMFDFHPAMLAIPSLLAAISLVERQRWRPALIWLVLALLTQDLVSLVVIAGGFVLVIRGRVRPGLMAVVLGFLVLGSDLVLLHQLDPAQWIQRILYLGNHSIPQIPTLIMAGLHQARTWLYLIWIFVPTLLFGFTKKSALWLLPLVPILILNLMSTNPATTSPFSQYSILMIPVLFMEWIEAQSGSAPVIGKPWGTLAMAIYVVFFLVFIGHESGIRHEAPTTHQAVALTAAVAVVPARAPVYCQNLIAPHLPNRPHLRLIAPQMVFPKGAYVILDTVSSLGTVPMPVIQKDVAALKPASVERFASQGIYVFQITHTVRGV